MSPGCPPPAYYRPLPGVPAVARRSMLPALPPEKKAAPDRDGSAGRATHTPLFLDGFLVRCVELVDLRKHGGRDVERRIGVDQCRGVDDELVLE